MTSNSSKRKQIVCTGSKKLTGISFYDGRTIKTNDGYIELYIDPENFNWIYFAERSTRKIIRGFKTEHKLRILGWPISFHGTASFEVEKGKWILTDEERVWTAEDKSIHKLYIEIQQAEYQIDLPSIIQAVSFAIRLLNHFNAEHYPYSGKIFAKIKDMLGDNFNFSLVRKAEEALKERNENDG